MFHSCSDDIRVTAAGHVVTASQSFSCVRVLSLTDGTEIRRVSFEGPQM
jgi:hypothetical protein